MIMAEKRIYTVGVLFFIISFFGTIAWELLKGWIWIYFEPLYVCSHNLRIVYVLSRRISQRYQLSFPPPIDMLKRSMRKSILLTQQEADYLGMSELEGVYIEFPLALICPRDPDYLYKVAMDSQGLDYEPSYIWHPDNRTLAYCPYCRLAVLLDGKIEKR
jgi:hypothetical protein